MDEMRAPRLPVPSDRALRWLKWIVAVSVLVSVVGGIIAAASFAGRLDAYSTALELAEDERDAIEETNDAQATAILDQREALREVNRRCRDAADCTPVPTPPVVVPGNPGPTGATGATGVTGARGPGPSASQVAIAVAAYCSSGACAGSGLTTGQVADAVALYCDRNGQCRGPAGTDGETVAGSKGEPGKDGQQGERGPGPTVEQIATAVAEYCADGRCTGATGPTGPTGAAGADSTVPGPPGRGIESVTCDVDTELFVVTYTDGTTAAVPGSDCVAGGLAPLE